MIYCGIGWAESTHDVALVDDTGHLVAERRITDDAAGYKILLDVLAEFGDTEEAPVPVAIETSRGLLVAQDGQAEGTRNQPDGRCPLPRPTLRLPQEVRPGRCPGGRGRDDLVQRIGMPPVREAG